MVISSRLLGLLLCALTGAFVGFIAGAGLVALLVWRWLW